MNTQHTQGRLKVQHPHASKRGWEVAFEPGLEQVCQNVTEKNARRLVACWNACDGIPTTFLEFSAMHEITQNLLIAKAQRDELLEALKRTARVLDKEHPAALKARAAIAKVEGGAT